MKRPLALGLRSRIVIALAMVMGVFILLTEFSVSKLVRVALSRHPAAVVEKGADKDKPGDGRDLFEKEVASLRRLVAFYMVTGAVVALILGAVAINRLAVKPLQRITGAVEQVAAGDLKTEAPVAGSDELVRLAVAFNRMTATLREQQAELQSRLDQLERSARELRETQDQLIQTAKLASVGTLAAGVAHEIGNPLAGLLGLLDVLAEEQNREAAGKYQALMRKEITRIDRIIGDLLLYARPVEYDPHLKVSCDVAEVLDHALALLRAQRLFDGVAIETGLGETPCSVAIARDDLTQVLINLLLNAAQAMDGRGRIAISAERIAGWRPALGVVARTAVRIAITDTGPGVSAEHADRIFDPFFSKKKIGEGTGLGLAICQSICNRVGGEISLDREYGPGARFAVVLPAA